MKITFLGTGAADWEADKHRHMEGYRRNASALIDDCLLIDPGPDVLDAMKTFGKKREEIRYIINTHKHSDHYCEQTLAQLRHAVFYPLKETEELVLGKYRITALKANHSTCEDAVHFLITNGVSNLFYGLDGAWLLYDEVEAIKRRKVDFAVFDATIGNVPGDWRVFEHNNLNMVLDMKNTLQPYIQRFCISHMARTLHGTQKELEAQMKPHGVEVAFDGYETLF